MSDRSLSPIQPETVLLVVGHGSRDDIANAEFEAVVARLRAVRTERVTHAYVEIAQPSLQEGLRAAASTARRVIVLPLFLFAAGHVKNDLPLALAEARRDFPGVEFVAAAPLGVHPALVELAFARLSTVARGAAPSTAVVVVGRGASDPDANGEFCKLVRLLGEGRDFAWVLAAFAGITRPRFEETIELAVRSRPERILVAPYLLFRGRLIDRLEQQVAALAIRYPWISFALAPPLGGEERVLQVMQERVQQAAQGGGVLPCDTCHYRVPIGGGASQVGGLRALLWSLRHSFTHTQAVPHVHAHVALRKHVLVCGNVDCAERGSIPLISALRRLVQQAGTDREIRITRTSCMGRCGEGPTLAVYPDGVWYRGVQEEDAVDLVHEHLLHDRLVARLVDSIMQ